MDQHPLRHPPILNPLAALVQSEGRRLLSEAVLAPDPARLAEGWERRFIADARRIEEAMALYQSLGFEVLAEPVRLAGLDTDCQDCRLAMLLQFKTIYTRRRQDPR